MGTLGKDGPAAGGATGTPPAQVRAKDASPAPAHATTPARKRARKRRPRFVL